MLVFGMLIFSNLLMDFSCIAPLAPTSIVIREGSKHGKVDQESAPLNVNLEMPLESDHY